MFVFHRIYISWKHHRISYHINTNIELSKGQNLGKEHYEKSIVTMIFE